MSTETSEMITAIATVFLALGTVALAVFTGYLANAAWKQLPLLNGQITALSTQIRDSRAATAETAKEHKEDKALAIKKQLEADTLHVCTLYDYDPTLHACCQRIWSCSDSGKVYDLSSVSKHDIITVANYLDGIAIGVLQRLYSAKIAKDHIGLTMQKFANIVLIQTFGNTQGYESLKRVVDDWYPVHPDISYVTNAGSE